MLGIIDPSILYENINMYLCVLSFIIHWQGIELYFFSPLIYCDVATTHIFFILFCVLFKVIQLFKIIPDVCP